MAGDGLLDLTQVLAGRSAIQAASVTGVATRVSSRTAENASSSPASAAVSLGKAPSARATRSRSWAVRGP